MIFISIQCVVGQERYVKTTYYDEAHEVVKEQYYVNDTIDNKLEGKYSSFFLSGSLKSEGNYVNNEASGIWKYYFENGNLKTTGVFDKGKSTGIWTYYFEQGGKRSEGLLENNKKVGEWVYYFENQEIKSRGKYNQDVREDIWNYFYEDGELKAQAYYDNGVGIYTEFYSSGKLKMKGLNKNGQSDSLWTYYYETGEKLARGYYKNGLKTGPWKYFFKNGNISSEGGYEEGNSVGNWIYYHEDGSKSAEGIQKGGLKDGYWNLYFQTGEVKGTGEYEQGTGPYKEYYSSGKLRLSGFFRKGLRDGLWTYYDENGDIEGEADFKKGTGEYIGYYSDGSKKMEGVLSDDKKIGEWKLYKKDGALAGTYFPLYEDEQPIFRAAESLDDSSDSRTRYDKPEYRFKSKQLRYFSSVVNEYKGIILSANPLLMPIGRLPFSLEYYIQERLGYELSYTLNRNPFFQRAEDIKQNDVYNSGSTFSFRQKFYNQDRSSGMFYFSHEIGYQYVNNRVNVEDANDPELITNVGSRESRYHYGILVGTRLMRYPGDAGFGMDIFAGVGIGRRVYEKKYTEQGYDQYFQGLNQSKTYIPIIVGLTFGYLGMKKREYYP
ncbi:membrane-binding protein [Reichenbachiella sp. MALMAid0571]|uniref:toxin-antitoxin system YwqK family antitoxin n=1 Tax=Reichenbachiella sp. MALMAid0571 TaxID=3143939 RepID=UPI0032DE73C1